MSRVLRAGFTGLAAIILLSAVSLQPAAARILCHGQFQVTQYGLIATRIAGTKRLRGSRIAMGGTEKPLRSTQTLLAKSIYARRSATTGESNRLAADT